MSRRKKKSSVRTMVVTLAGSFSAFNAGGRQVGRKRLPIAVVMDRSCVEVVLLDPKTSKPTHRIVFDDARALAAAIHALETVAW